MKLTPHPLLVSWSRKSRAILLIPLRAVRPVQSLSACTTAHCTFTYLTVKAIPLLPLWAVQPVQSLSACTTAHCTFTYLTVKDIPLLPLWAVQPVQSLSACTTAHCTFTYLTVKAIPLLPLWAVQPVQSHNACTKVHFIFTLCGYKSTTFSDCVLYQIYHHLQKRSSELHGKFQEFRYVNLLLRYPMLPNCLFVQYPWKPNGVSFGRHFQ